MQLTVNSLTALSLTRAIRSNMASAPFSSRCDLMGPDPGPTGRWSSRMLHEELARFGAAGSFDKHRPLHAVVANKQDRLQINGLKCAFRTTGHPADAFIDLGNGLAMSSPELLFIELANVMEPAVHHLLGMELCGRFSRDAVNPRSGQVTYGLEPVTTIERLRSFAQQAISIRGARKALQSVDLIVENAWSPMEALLASLIMLPGEEFGYDLWPITLNPRMEVSEQLKPYAAAASRVPDIRFSGTSVGLNYDGEDHFGLRRIAQAAAAAERSPGNAHLAQEVEEAIADARRRIVSDKRRDRDLETMGYVVLPVTKEDFDEQGGIDRVMGQVIEAIERERKRDLTRQRQLLEDESLATARQLFIWSLMPGGSAADARRKKRKIMADKAQEDLGESTMNVERESDASATALLDTPVDRAPQPLEVSDTDDELLPEFLWTRLLDKVIAAEYLSKRLYDALTCEA